MLSAGTRVLCLHLADDGGMRMMNQKIKIIKVFDYFRRGIGTAMLNMGIEKVRERNIFPTSGWPMEETRCMMCQDI